MLNAVLSPWLRDESFAGGFLQFFFKLLQHFTLHSGFEPNQSKRDRWENSDPSVSVGNSRSEGPVCALHSGVAVLCSAAMVKLSGAGERR